MTLVELLGRLSASTETALLSLWARHLAGELTEEKFITGAAAVIDRANGQATTAADVAMAAVISSQLGRPVAPVGVAIVSDQPRLRDAVRTVLAAEVDHPQNEAELVESKALRLGRLARAEPSSTAQDAAGTAMERHGVSGWTRAASARACPLCRRWADGQVRAPSTRMARHVGCTCMPRPVAMG